MRSTGTNAFRVIIVIASLFWLTAASASPVWHNATIRSIYPLSDGAVVLQFHSDSSSCPSTSTPHYYYARVGENGLTQNALDNILATALTAATLGIPVEINFDSASTLCYINRLRINFDP